MKPLLTAAPTFGTVARKKISPEQANVRRL